MKPTLLCLLILTSLAFGQTKKPAPVKKLVTSCVAGPNEKCPSDLQIREWTEIKALEAKYAPPTPTDDDRIRYQGLVSDWNKNIPTGFHWDTVKTRWVVNPPEAPKPEPAKPAPTTPPAPEKK